MVLDQLNYLNHMMGKNYYLYDLPGLKPVITVGRNYPYNESYSHVLGYVAYASKEDLSSNEIINKVRGINRVVYDISGKPPSTIEWE